jgi:hypothetical protein
MTRIFVLISCLFFSCGFQGKNKQGLDSTAVTGSTNRTSGTIVQDRDYVSDTVPAPEYQNNIDKIGIGVCSVQREKFQLYDDTLSLAYSVELYSPQYAGVQPFLFKPDYGIFYFVVLSKRGAYYEVLRNEWEHAFIPVNQTEKYVNWPDFLKSTVAVSNNNWDTNPAVKKKQADQPDTDFAPAETVEVSDVDGEWLYVLNENGQGTWIRWRKNDQLLVRILLLM